jgi:hypothetical protein
MQKIDFINKSTFVQFEHQQTTLKIQQVLSFGAYGLKEVGVVQDAARLPAEKGIAPWGLITVAGRTRRKIRRQPDHEIRIKRSSVCLNGYRRSD